MQSRLRSDAHAIRVGGVLCDKPVRNSRGPPLIMWEMAYVKELLGAPDVRVHLCPAESDTGGIHVFVATSIVWWRVGIDAQVRQALRQNASVLIHLGDENCAWGRKAWKHYSRFRLVLRQWTCWRAYQSEYDRNRMVAAIPLGFNSKLAAYFDPNASSSLHAAAITLRSLRSAPLQQEFTWSLPGRIKTDRQMAIDTFEARLAGQANVHGLRSHKETLSIMRASHFVLSGRGNVALDCFRLYEASIMGAIPVLATTRAEYNSSFGRFCHSPPWIRGESWADAAMIVAELLRNKTAVRRRQLAVVEWWIRELQCARNKVGTALGIHMPVDAENLLI